MDPKAKFNMKNVENEILCRSIDFMDRSKKDLI
jgi:hypothetical protein